MGFNRDGYLSMTAESGCVGYWIDSELKIDGIFTALFYAVNNTGTDYLGVIYNFPDTSTAVIRQVNAMLGSFTGFHRCFTNDELYNEESEETIKDFKLKYAGRVVISSGKIATSTNGTTWTQKVTGISVSDTVYSVTYHREKWYIINVNGSVYRSNTSDPTGTWSNMGDITTDTLTTNVELRSNEAYMFYADSAGDNVVLIR